MVIKVEVFTLLTLEFHAMLRYGSAFIVACSIKMVIYARISEYLDSDCKVIILSKSTKQTTPHPLNSTIIQ